MPQSIDVGSILGGRYKVTGRILASAENDVILDGLDQVLNRPVSILVAAEENASHLTASAREVATGVRASNISILDLGVQDGSTYLIAGRTSPADLLDLVVPTEAVEEVYQEPFFTDTLGTEIFGQARDAAPMSGAYVYDDDSPLTPARPQPPVNRNDPPTAAVTPAPPAQPAAVEPPQPRVTLWQEEDYEQASYEDRGRGAGVFPAELRGDDPQDYEQDDVLEDDDENAPRTGGRWLTGAIVSVLLIGALVFAAQHIGTLFNGSENQAGGNTTSAPAPTQTEDQPSAPPEEPAAVAPVITGLTDITTYAEGQPNYGEPFFPRLKDAIDGNKATYWPTVEFSNADFAGLTEGIRLVVELKEESTISQVTINQLAGAGGQFNILSNSKPELQGATRIGGGSFSSPDFSLAVAPGVKAKYIIINFTELPKLQSPVTYPYGLKITEIGVK